MRTNIDDIIDSVLPSQEMHADDYYINGYNYARLKLKQAITEKKLVVPLSEEAIEKIIGDIHYDLLGTGTPNGKFHSKCAKAIYQAQFGERK